MPTFDQYQNSQVIKMLYLGDSGAGKTGSLMSLAAAGYNLRILDLDNGVEVLKDFIMNEAQSPYLKPNPPHWTQDTIKGLLGRVRYTTITEEFIIQGTNMIPKGNAWNKISAQLNDWKDPPGESLGNISKWGPQDILVVDSLSRVASMAFNFTLVLNGRAVSAPHQSDFGAAQTLVERFLGLLYSDAIKCNVIVIAHIALIENDQGVTKGFAQTIGKALAPKVGQYFNHALQAKSSGQGTAVKREILTNTSGMVELKTPAPLRVKPSYPLASGLAEYFAAVKGAPTKS